MKAHSNLYKEKLKELGREIDARIKHYKPNGLNTEDDKNLYTESDIDLLVEQANWDEISEIIQSEDIYNLDIIQKSEMFKSYMGEVDFEVKQNLSIGDGIEAEFGLKVDNEKESVAVSGKSTQNGTPTPSNPIEIVNLTGNTSVEIPSGKNLWRFSQDDWYMNTSINSYTILNINQLSVTSNNSAYANVKFELNIPDGIYTFSLGNVVNSNSNMTIKRMSLVTYVGNTRTVIQHIDQGTPRTVTITNQPGKQYLIEFWASYATALVNTAIFSNIQVEKGNTATSFESYQSEIYNLDLGDIELNSIGSYKDKIYNVGENWYLQKSTSKIILNGTENWTTRGGGTTYAYQLTNVFGTSGLEGLCDYWKFIRNGASNSQANECMASVSSNTNLCIFTNNSDLNSVANLKTWLSQKKPVLIIQNTTPTTTQITDENLLIELNKIKEGYEHLNYGKYIIYKKEYNEDTATYSYKSYDKMLYSMKPYELNVEYPLTVREYIESIGDVISIPLDENIDIVNGDLQILSNPYYEVNVTYRDVLDDLSAIVGAPIRVKDDKLTIAYPQDTEDTIDDEYLKDINVSFGEKYGPINKLTFSKLDGEDVITRQDLDSISTNGTVELKIEDNALLQFDNWEEFIDPLFNQIKGTTYYINDLESIGVTYYDIMDKFTVQRGESTYNCVMLNDEIKINQGLEEKIYAEKPKQTVNVYETSNQSEKGVSFTIDRQNKRITSKVGKNDVISSINQTPEEITIQASKLSLEGYTTINDGFSVDLQGNMTCNDAIIHDATFNGGHITLDSEGNDEAIWVGKQGDQCSVRISGEWIQGYGITRDDPTWGDIVMPTFDLWSLFDEETEKSSGWFFLRDWEGFPSIEMHGNIPSIDLLPNISMNGTTGVIDCVRVNQTSLEENKKNIEKFEHGLEEVLKTDIYKYNLKFEDDDAKKSVGFIIGKDYNYSKEMTTVIDGVEKGADTYSMISVCLQAIKEQQEQIEELKKEINKLKGGN